MRKQTRWFHEYRGINIEICCMHREPSPYMEYDKAWTFYLHLAIEQFPEELRPLFHAPQRFTDFGTPLTNYSEVPLNGLDWHCDMTWYSKEWNEDSVFKTIKAGCDYQHYWDNGRHDLYDERFVAMEAEQCVNSLFKSWPDLKTMEQLWKEHRAKFPGEKK